MTVYGCGTQRVSTDVSSMTNGSTVSSQGSVGGLNVSLNSETTAGHGLARRSEFVEALESVLNKVKVCFTKASDWVISLFKCHQSSSVVSEDVTPYSIARTSVDEKSPSVSSKSAQTQAGDAVVTSLKSAQTQTDSAVATSLNSTILTPPPERATVELQGPRAAFTSLGSFSPDMKVVLPGLFELSRVILNNNPSVLQSDELSGAIRSSLQPYVDGLDELTRATIIYQLSAGGASDIYRLLDFSMENIIVDREFLTSSRIVEVLLEELHGMLTESPGIKSEFKRDYESKFVHVSQIPLPSQSALELVGCPMSGFINDPFFSDSAASTQLNLSAYDGLVFNYPDTGFGLDDTPEVIASLTDTLTHTLVSDNQVDDLDKTLT